MKSSLLVFDHQFLSNSLCCTHSSSPTNFCIFRHIPHFFNLDAFTANDVTRPVVRYRVCPGWLRTEMLLRINQKFLIIPKKKKLQGGPKGPRDDKSLMRAVPCRDHSSPSFSWVFLLGVVPPPPPPPPFFLSLPNESEGAKLKKKILKSRRNKKENKISRQR
jgi:hypothetical protein